MAREKDKIVHCRYPKCSKLHESTELKESEAVKGGSRSYYHPDCYHMMQTISQIKDVFYRDINPTLTGKQIGQLVSIVNNMVFGKGIDVDFILFAINYFVNYKPGKLKYPAGVTYIIQDCDVITAWDKKNQRQLREEINEELRKQQKAIMRDDEGRVNIPDEIVNVTTNNNKKSRFSSVLGV